MNDTMEMNLDTDDILDMVLDDLEDLPSYKPFPPGVHIADLSWEEKEVNSEPAFILNAEYVEPVELVDSEDEVPQPGDQSGSMFILTNEYARGALKPIAKEFASNLGNVNSLRDLLNCGVVRAAITTKIRVNKDDPDKVYLDIKEVAIIS